MFARLKAIRELQSMLRRYKNEYDRCEDKDEERELVDVIENLEWVIKELDYPDEKDETDK